MKSPAPCELICLHPRDNVAVAVRALRAGAGSEVGSRSVRIAEPVPQGHKVALEPIAVGAPIVKFGEIIGFASQAIELGEWVHSHNVSAEEFARRCERADAVPRPPEPLEGQAFLGYRRAGGRAGTRNYLAVISSVNCSASVSRWVARRFDAAALRAFPNVDGVVAFTHGGGCGMQHDGLQHQILNRVLGGIARHPNIGGYLLIGLGCETASIGHLLSDQRLVQIGGERTPGEQAPFPPRTPRKRRPVRRGPPVLSIQDLRRHAADRRRRRAATGRRHSSPLS